MLKKKNKDAQKLARLSVASRKKNKPKQYWVDLARAGASVRWKNHVKINSQEKWQKDNPEKTRAHIKVRQALKAGKIRKGVCFCGSKKTDGHHDDYSRPLEVVWLCRKHHLQKHKKLSTV